MDYQNDLVYDTLAFQCDRCNRVMLQHYDCNCTHRFCQQCNLVLGDGLDGRKCPKCRKTIEKIEKAKDLQFQSNALQLRLYCPFKKDNCGFQGTLADVWDHVKNKHLNVSSNSQGSASANNPGTSRPPVCPVQGNQRTGIEEEETDDDSLGLL